MKRIFTMLSVGVTLLLWAGLAFAQEAAAEAHAAAEPNPIALEHGGFLALAIAFGIGLAAFGGAFGQSRAAAAALEGISRNPNAADKVFVPMLLGLAFIESLVLFTWVLMFLMLNANLM